jgi:hypothetical protein
MPARHQWRNALDKLITLVILVTLTAATASPSFARGKKYGPGATDTEIKLRRTMPYGAPASSLSLFGKVEIAYFKLIARSKCRTAGYANAFTGHITRQIGYQKLHYTGAILGRTQSAKRIGLCLSLRAQIARGGSRLDSRALDNAGRDAIDPHTVRP